MFFSVCLPPPITVCSVGKRFLPWECAWTAQVNLTETVDVIIKIFYIKLIGFALH